MLSVLNKTFPSFLARDQPLKHTKSQTRDPWLFQLYSFKIKHLVIFVACFCDTFTKREEYNAGLSSGWTQRKCPVEPLWWCGDSPPRALSWPQGLCGRTEPWHGGVLLERDVDSLMGRFVKLSGWDEEVF